jgi:hypothetical protein
VERWVSLLWKGGSVSCGTVGQFDVEYAIGEDNDVDILEELIDLESRYGRSRMDHALGVLGRMNVDNPKRNFPYLKGIVQTE